MARGGPATCSSEYGNATCYAGCREPLDACSLLSWHDVAYYQLLIPFIALIVIRIVASFLLHPFLTWRSKKFCLNSKHLHRAIEHWIGTGPFPPKHVLFMNVMHTIQIILSLSALVLFVVQTYRHEDYRATWGGFDFGFYIVYYIIMGVRENFTASYVMGVGSLIDVFTIVGQVVVYAGYGDTVWLNLTFLRAWRIPQCFDLFVENGVFARVPAVQRQVMLFVVKLLALVSTFSSCILFTELMGAIPDFQDETHTTWMGPNSWFQMIYWMFITVTTVGYGEYGPVMLLSRLFTSAFILLGVVYFSFETSKIAAVSLAESMGKGRYHVRKNAPPHIILLGGGLKSYSPVMTAFLSELICQDCKERIPEVVCLATNECPPALKQLMSERWSKGKIQYFIGSPVSAHDLYRVQFHLAGMIFICGDLSAADQSIEDQENIMRALSCQQDIQAETGLGVMLTCPQSRIKAMSAGIPQDVIFNYAEMKSTIMAQSCRCPGFSTMVLNLITTDQFQAGASDPEWLQQYMFGMQMEVYGFCLAEQFWGRMFSEVVAEIYCMQGKRNSSVLILAAQVKGIIMMNPANHVIEQHQVVFAIAHGRKHLQDFELGNKKEPFDWRAKIFENRRVFQSELSSLDLVKVENTQRDLMERPESFSPDYQTAEQMGPHKKDLTSRIEKALESFSEQSLSSKMQVEEEQAEAVSRRGGHILLGMVHASAQMWLQVEMFLQPLRAPELPDITPVVILSDSPPPQEMLNYGDVAFLVGSPTQITDLMKAGVNNALAVVLMTCGTQSPFLSDASAMIAYMALEACLGAGSATGCKCIVEFSNSFSTNLLRPSEPTSDVPKEAAEPTLLGSKSLHLFVHGPAHGGSDSRGTDKEFFTNPRVASGEIITPSQLGALFALGFWTPGIMEFMAALASPSRMQQTSIIWQAPIPQSFVGKSYHELFRHCMREGGAELINEGLRAEPQRQAELNAILPLGLYRPAGHLGNAMPFVVTNPDHKSVLVQGDAVYVLASALWGRLLHSTMLMRCDSDGTRPQMSIHPVPAVQGDRSIAPNTAGRKSVSCPEVPAPTWRVCMMGPEVPKTEVPKRAVA